MASMYECLPSWPSLVAPSVDPVLLNFHTSPSLLPLEPPLTCDSTTWPNVAGVLVMKPAARTIPKMESTVTPERPSERTPPPPLTHHKVVPVRLSFHTKALSLLAGPVTTKPSNVAVTPREYHPPTATTLPSESIVSALNVVQHAFPTSGIRTHI